MTILENRKSTPEQIYRQLMGLWQLHLSVSDPNLDYLDQLHRLLCSEETVLCESRLDLCLENLQQRLRDALALGLALQLPLWATTQAEVLEARLRELQG
jgi:hypothetical protein